MKKVILTSCITLLLSSCVVATTAPVNNDNNNSSSGTTSENSGSTGSIGKDPIVTGANLEVKSPTTLKQTDFSLESSSEETKLSLEKFIFSPEEDMKIKLSAPESFYSNSSWIAVLNAKSPGGSSKTNDQYDINYIYVKDTKGMEFINIKAPSEAGIYELRLNDGNEDDSKEVNRIKFLVSTSNSITDNKIKLAKNIFKKGEKIALEYESSLEIMDLKPWIAVVPNNIPHVDATLNDSHDIDYKYLDNRNSGTLIFDSAGYEAGKYDFRLNDDLKGKEVIYLSFEITN